MYYWFNVPFGLQGGMWNLIVLFLSLPFYLLCLSFHFYIQLSYTSDLHMFIFYFSLRHIISHSAMFLFILQVFLDCLPYVQSCINPIIYCFMSRNFRRSIRVLFSRKLQDSVTRPNTADLMELQTFSSSSEAKRNQSRAQYFQLIYRGNDYPT